MKRLAAMLICATILCLTSISGFAQSVTYLAEVPDREKCEKFKSTKGGTTEAYLQCTLENNKTKLIPATLANYDYKRVMEYKQAIVSRNFGIDINGGMTTNPKATGLHYCLLTDYYKTGERALTGNFVSGDIYCSQQGGFFDGQVVAYYKDGTIKRTETWSSGEMNGVVIFYNESGNETKREEYVNGKLIEESKFAAPADSPITGTWKYVEYETKDSPKFGGGREKSTYVTRTSIYIYSPNGIVESTHQNIISTNTIKGNWKYTPKTASAGILEEYQGEDLIERGTVKFLNRNQLEYMIMFSPNPNAIGKQYVWMRQ